MSMSSKYAAAALDLARQGRWVVAYWLLERARRSAPIELLADYIELAERARELAARQMLLMCRTTAVC